MYSPTPVSNLFVGSVNKFELVALNVNMLQEFSIIFQPGL